MKVTVKMNDYEKEVIMGMVTDYVTRIYPMVPAYVIRSKVADGVNKVFGDDEREFPGGLKTLRTINGNKSAYDLDMDIDDMRKWREIFDDMNVGVAPIISGIIQIVQNFGAFAKIAEGITAKTNEFWARPNRWDFQVVDDFDNTGIVGVVKYHFDGYKTIATTETRLGKDVPEFLEFMASREFSKNPDDYTFTNADVYTDALEKSVEKVMREHVTFFNQILDVKDVKIPVQYAAIGDIVRPIRIGGFPDDVTSDEVIGEARKINKIPEGSWFNMDQMVEFVNSWEALNRDAHPEDWRHHVDTYHLVYVGGIRDIEKYVGCMEQYSDTVLFVEFVEEEHKNLNTIVKAKNDRLAKSRKGKVVKINGEEK